MRRRRLVASPMEQRVGSQSARSAPRCRPWRLTTRPSLPVFGDVLDCVLPTQTQLGNDLAISLDVATSDVVEKATTSSDHHQKSAATVMVVRMLLQVLGQMVDAFREQRDLYLGGTRIGSVRPMLCDRLVLGCASHGVFAFRLCRRRSQAEGFRTCIAPEPEPRWTSPSLRPPEGKRSPVGPILGGAAGVDDSSTRPLPCPSMFTGIVEELGTILASGPGPAPSTVRLRIAASVVLEGSSLGASIAVNGCCLTLVDSHHSTEESWWETDVSSETLERTTVGSLHPGDQVNLERPMALGDRLGGHLVLGHVDGVGEVVSAAPDLVVRVPRHLMKYIVEKGSVTVDGVSLTAFDLTQDTFRVAVIPHTEQVTTLGRRGPGSRVNLEMDVLAKHIERLVEPYQPAG